VHVDELQSDLHTKGSQDGYSTPELDAEDAIQLGKMSSGISTDLNNALADFLQAVDNPSAYSKELLDVGGFNKTEFLQKIKDIQDLYAAAPTDKYSLVRMRDAANMIDFGFKNYELPKTISMSNLQTKLDDAFKIASAKEARVPNYPFKDDWYAMSLKQILKDAIDGGADAISVSSSAPIKARYSDQYSKFYETLYDQKIPSAMKKLANKYGGKFEKGKLDVDDTFGEGASRFTEGENFANNPRNELVKTNIIRITPEMKKKILEEGFSNFAIGGAVLKPFSIDNIDIFNP
jgi:hypothetical protein